MAVGAGVSTKYLFNTVTASASDEGLPSCTISTISTDREGDRVIPEGGDFADFMKSPVLMWAHGGKDGYSSIPIGTVTSLNVQPGQGVQASWKWLEGDPFAERIKNAWDQGVVRASSIGFKPVQATPNGQGLDHEKWQLLELSLCAIPMNPEAVRTLKSLGLMDEPSEPVVLFGPDGQPLPPTAHKGDPMALSVDELEATLKVKELDALQKRGRVVSAVNESRLRAAMDALANAGAVLNEVLAQLMPMDEPAADMPIEEDGMTPMPMHPEDMPPKKPMPTMALDEAETYSLQIAEDEPSVLRLTLADDVDGESFLTLTDDKGREPTFSIDPVVMRSVIAEAVRDQLQSALVQPIGESIQRALDQARGRLH